MLGVVAQPCAGCYVEGKGKTVFPDFRGAVYRIPSIAGRPIFETDTGAESQESCPCRIPCRYDWFPVHLCLFKSMAEVQNGADLPRKNER